MKEKISITIEGIVRDMDESSSITTNGVGEYSQVEDMHIIQYKELANEEDKGSINTIKASPSLVEMAKSGENSTNMTFDLKKETYSVYETPYGSLNFQVNTKNINIVEKPNEIIITMEYSLSHNNNHISDNQIKIVVR
jgi:uncharacterized beta-barrel protein YwiB (DUF1934 family)